LESTSSQASFLVLIFLKKVGFSLAKFGKVMMPFYIKTYISFMLNQDAPSVVLFEKHLFAASFLVLIFSKKAGFSFEMLPKKCTRLSDSCPVRSPFWKISPRSIIFGADIP